MSIRERFTESEWLEVVGLPVKACQTMLDVDARVSNPKPHDLAGLATAIAEGTASEDELVREVCRSVESSGATTPSADGHADGVGDVATAGPEVTGRSRRVNAELRGARLEAMAEAMGLVAMKAPDSEAAYREWLVATAARVAGVPADGLPPEAGEGSASGAGAGAEESGGHGAERRSGQDALADLARALA